MGRDVEARKRGDIGSTWQSHTSTSTENCAPFFSVGPCAKEPVKGTPRGIITVTLSCKAGAARRLARTRLPSHQVVASADGRPSMSPQGVPSSEPLSGQQSLFWNKTSSRRSGVLRSTGTHGIPRYRQVPKRKLTADFRTTPYCSTSCTDSSTDRAILETVRRQRCTGRYSGSVLKRAARCSMVLWQYRYQLTGTGVQHKRSSRAKGRDD